MSKQIPLTKFSDTERVPIEVVRKQSALFTSSPMAVGLANSAVNGVLVLNPQRQIVFASQSAVNMTDKKLPDDILGLRLGEAMGCIHARESGGNCGSTEHCELCGGLHAILTSLAGRHCQQECQLTRIMNVNAEALDLLVFATPFSYQNEQYTILSINDISHEKRRLALERVFFHDLINLAGGLEGFLSSIKSTAPDDLKSDLSLAHEGLQQLVEEVMAQKALAAAEHGELTVVPESIKSDELMRAVQRIYQSHPVARDRELAIRPGSSKVEFVSDRTLLKRVLGNLVKNALEAIQPGQTVTISCRQLNGTIQFLVQNPTFMTRDVQLQVFKRSFSTKGSGRGLGTYSVKLITERYLKGEVAFSSTSEAGTVFTVSLPLSGLGAL
jgi:signal transduction histidine kinase